MPEIESTCTVEKTMISRAAPRAWLAELRARARDYYVLTKPEVNLLILMSSSAGYILGSHGRIHLLALINTLVGTLLVASGTATLNQFMERTHDARMRRTANRPLPARRISPWEALALGVGMSVAGGVYLAWLVNTLTSLLAIATLLSYLLIYTPLKRKTPLCTLLGAFPGAMPTLIGWAGAGAQINREALSLFVLLFVWQFPHFLAIALMYRDDYERAGYKMLPGFDREGRFTRVEIVGLTVLLAVASFMCVLERGLGVLSFLAMASLAGFILYYSLKLMASGTKAAASHLLHASIVYLPAALLVLLLHKP